MPYVPPSGGSPLWQNIQNKPPAFPPTAHTHATADIGQPFQSVSVKNNPPDDATPSLTTISLVNRAVGGGDFSWNMYTAAIGGGFGVQPNSFEIWNYPAAKCRLRITPGGDTYLCPTDGIVYAGSGENRLLNPGKVGIAKIGGTFSQIDFLDDETQWAIHVNQNRLYFIYEPWNYLSLVLDATNSGVIGMGMMPQAGRRLSIEGRQLIQYSPTSTGANDFSDISLELFSSDGLKHPGIAFHKGGVSATALRYQGAFDFLATDNVGNQRKLAFYDSGMWTPSIRGASTIGSATYATRSGRWSRNGNLVLASFFLNNMNPTGINSGDSLQLAGLPFLSANLATGISATASIGSYGGFALGSGYSQLGGILFPNRDRIDLRKSSATNTAPSVGVVPADLVAGSNFIFGSITYEV